MPRPKICSISDAERKARIITLRGADVPYRAIAEELGISVSTAHKIYEAACREIPAEALHTIRVEFREDYDRASRGLWAIAEGRVQGGSSATAKVEAYRALLSWRESLRKLYGADAPTRREITVVSEDAIDNAIAELNREIARMDEQAKAAGAKSMVDA